MSGGRRRPLRGVLAALAFGAVALSCTDGTGPDASLRLLFDTGTVTPGSNLQLTALDASGEVVWSSDDPGVATVVSRTGWVTGVAPGTTTIRADDGTSQAAAQIQVRTPPLLRVSAPSVAFEAVAGEGDPAPVTLAVTNDGDLPLTGIGVEGLAYGPGEPTGWLSTALSATSAPAELVLSVDADGLAPGIYTATLTVGSSVAVNGPQSVAVTLVVLRPPSIELDRTEVELGTIPGVDSPPASVAVGNGGDRPLTGLAVAVEYPSGPGGWLDAALDGSTAPATLTLRARGAGLSQGQYAAVVRVTSTRAGVASRTVAVALVVAPGPAITLSADDVTFGAVVGQGAPPPKTVQITNGGGGTLDQLALGAVAYGGAGGWLSATLNRTVAPAQVALQVNATGLAPGTYTASFEIRSPVADNSPRTVDVTLTVDQAPVIALTPASWSFTSVRTRGDPPAQGMQITNVGGGVLTGLSVSVAYGGGASGWLDLTLASTTGPTTLVGAPRAAGLAVGTYTATVTVRSDVPGVASRTFFVEYRVIWSFQIDIQPFFTTGYAGFGFTPCTNCHFAGGTSPDLSSAVAAYQALVGAGRVVAGDPDAGVLICKIEGRAGCGTAMPLPAAQIARIRAWIQQGAAY